jgi:hypothetical protein
MKDELMLSLLVVKGRVNLRNDRLEFRNQGCRGWLGAMGIYRQHFAYGMIN